MDYLSMSLISEAFDGIEEIVEILKHRIKSERDIETWALRMARESDPIDLGRVILSDPALRKN